LKRKPNFCGDYHLAAPAFERSADQFLVPEGTIDLDCVEEGATWLDRAMQCGDRLRFVGRSTRLAQAHAAETDG
jgi:hypothetical protein